MSKMLIVYLRISLEFHQLQPSVQWDASLWSIYPELEYNEKGVEEWVGIDWEGEWQS